VWVVGEYNASVVVVIGCCYRTTLVIVQVVQIWMPFHPAPIFLTKHLPGAVTAGPASSDVCVAIQCVLLHGRAPGDACAWHLEGLNCVVYSTNIAFQSREVVVL
jgi:hypothetical protein